MWFHTGFLVCAFRVVCSDVCLQREKLLFRDESNNSVGIRQATTAETRKRNLDEM